MSTDLTKQATVEIKENYSYIEQAFEIALEKAQRIGEILCERKTVMDKAGESFGEWIEKELPFCKATARNWMYLWNNRTKIVGANTIAEAKRMIAPAEEKEPPPKDTPKDNKPKGNAPKDTPKKPATPKKLQTSTGEDVPDDLVEIFDRTGELKEHVASLNKILGEIRKLCNEGDELYMYVTLAAFESAMKNATRQLRFALPYAVCLWCGGDRVIGTATPSQCPCKGTGWINKTTYDSAPSDLKG